MLDRLARLLDLLLPRRPEPLPIPVRTGPVRTGGWVGPRGATGGRRN